MTNKKKPVLPLVLAAYPTRAMTSALRLVKRARASPTP